MPAPISEFVRVSLLIVGALFPIVNTPQNIPIFLSLTTGLSSRDRSVLARRIALNGFALLIGSVLIGTHVLSFFGISLPVVQVGGGMVVVASGWKLLNRADDHEKPPESSVRTPKASLLSTFPSWPQTNSCERSNAARAFGISLRNA